MVFDLFAGSFPSTGCVVPAPERVAVPPRGPLGRPVPGAPEMRVRWTRTLSGRVAVEVRVGGLVSVETLADLDATADREGPESLAARILVAVTSTGAPAVAGAR